MGDAAERRISWIMLAAGLLVMGAMFALSSNGMVRGLDSGHPVEYLQGTCIAGAIVLIIIFALRLLNVAALPMWFVAMLYGDIFYYVLSLCQGLYLDVSWWGYVSHMVASSIVGCIVFVAMCAIHEWSPPHVTLGTGGGIVAMTFLTGLAFGGIWEIIEGYIDIILGASYMSYSAIDTLCDLAADAVGMACAAAAVWFALRKGGAKHVLAGVRIGKNAMNKG
ncbi:MAG: hypothetical protein LBG62_05135 [Candidatus Methanoplasma sp.]|jgi:hypothetical protein|nr:hypothetical protein [Candidatus Methanoplasma sp.]